MVHQEILASDGHYHSNGLIVGVMKDCDWNKLRLLLYPETIGDIANVR
jgi:hypothetical protein